MTLLTPKEPESNWVESFLSPSLRDARPYSIDAPEVEIKLDQNENPSDWPQAIKDRICHELSHKDWNRYPEAFTDRLSEKVARYSGVAADSCLLGCGSNYLLSVLFNTFARACPGKVFLARPSFALYESHCRYENINYEPWVLTEDLEYDVSALEDMPNQSMVVFASPNNPPGNSLDSQKLKNLLLKHPSSLFVADEAYVEFSDDPYTKLIAEHSNLILVRTFSKTLSLAGARIGYLLAHPTYLHHLKKLRLPFMLNHFSSTALDVILDDPNCQRHIEKSVAMVKSERSRVLSSLQEASGDFQVFGSEANFLLVKWREPMQMTHAYRHLVAKKILVRDVSAGPLLQGCLRITIGSTKENDALIAALSQ